MSGEALSLGQCPCEPKVAQLNRRHPSWRSTAWPLHHRTMTSCSSSRDQGCGVGTSSTGGRISFERTPRTMRQPTKTNPPVITAKASVIRQPPFESLPQPGRSAKPTQLVSSSFVGRNSLFSVPCWRVAFMSRSAIGVHAARATQHNMARIASLQDRIFTR